MDTMMKLSDTGLGQARLRLYWIAQGTADPEMDIQSSRFESQSELHVHEMKYIHRILHHSAPNVI